MSLSRIHSSPSPVNLARASHRPNGQVYFPYTSLSLHRWLVLSAAIAFGIFMALSRPGSAARAQESPEPSAYTVVAGDTLLEIATRFDVTLEDLIAANGIVDANLVVPGQVLIIPDGASVPAASTANTVLMRALPGDTLTSLAQRAQQEAPALANLNQLPESARLFPGQPIRILDINIPPEPRSFGAILSAAFTEDLAQGKTGHAVVTTRRPLELQGDWNGLPIAFTPGARNPLRQFALLPVPALLEPGPYSLTIGYTSTDDIALSRSWTVNVFEGDYERSEINLPPDRGVLLAPEIVQTELALLTEQWSERSPDLLSTGVFSRPIDIEYPTTGPFGTRRSYNGGPYSSYHAGQDFGAPAGITVTAPADGVVVLSEPLDVRGNAILLDHGRGIFTGYWHLDESYVQPGQHVHRGDVLGLVGNTGLSTGAHLHWELRIYGVAVDPMQFTEEPLQP